MTPSTQPVSGWTLRIFAEGSDGAVIENKLAALRKEAEKAGVAADSRSPFDKIEDGLRELFAKI